jgi:hypothetical protein
VRAVLPSGFCVFHDPAHQDQLGSIRAAGGHAKSRTSRARRLLPIQLRPVLDALVAALDEVHAGTLAPQRAAAMAALAGAIVKVLTVSELEERIAVLERQRWPGA